MRSGALRKQIAIQVEVATTDSAGGYGLAWTNLAVVWAEIKPVTGREVYAAGHVESHITHSMSIRYRGDVTSSMRVSYNGRMFNIHAVLNADERNVSTELLVEEGGAV